MAAQTLSGVGGDGGWPLDFANLEDMTYMQIPAALRSLLLDLGSMSPGQAAASHGVDLQTVRSLLQQLALTGMLVGTAPPQPPKRKFKPTDLLFYKLSLCNPDRWLSRTFPAVAWIWTRPFALSLAGFLAVFAVVGLAQRESIMHMGMQLWQAMGPGVFLPFGLLSMAVVALHELGHAYTLKRYGGVVPEVGLLFMCLMPAAYTNTTDQYALPRRRQRALVVGAGLLCQGAIAALAWVGWNLSVPGSWLATASYLLLVAALFTVAMNLNPMARFDGYFLLMALTGINNLRSRSFGYYRSLLSRQPCREPGSIRWILALYAPLESGVPGAGVWPVAAVGGAMAAGQPALGDAAGVGALGDLLLSAARAGGTDILLRAQSLYWLQLKVRPLSYQASGPHPQALWAGYANGPPLPKMGEGEARQDFPAPLRPLWEKGLGDEGKVLIARVSGLMCTW
ncbi:MAG: hypothetical protein HC812_18585 [Leptolyngbya sp. RL_3_1]|nr:hypothetical protein [Leptolyngbya sp. RL_3_1]